MGFLLVYLRNRQAWWAIIPCGVMITLALVTGLESESELGVGGVFFLGLALTFLVVYLVPNPEGRMTWALIPAAVLGIMGFLILAAAVQLIGFLWPLALVVVGAYLLFRALRQCTGSSRAGSGLENSAELPRRADLAQHLKRLYLGRAAPSPARLRICSAVVAEPWVHLAVPEGQGEITPLSARPGYRHPRSRVTPARSNSSPERLRLSLPTG